jgi:hypothetical protein
VSKLVLKSSNKLTLVRIILKVDVSSNLHKILKKLKKNYYFFKFIFLIIDARTDKRTNTQKFFISVLSFFDFWTETRVMFNCSNCDSSKNWSTQKYNCLTPFEQLSKKLTTGQKSKTICRICILSSFTFRQKINDCQVRSGQVRSGQVWLG